MKYLKESTDVAVIQIKPIPEYVDRILTNAIEKGLDFTTVCLEHNINASDYYQVNEIWLARNRKENINHYDLLDTNEQIIQAILVKSKHRLYKRYSATEKLEIILTIQSAGKGIKKHLRLLGIPGATYYNWRRKLNTKGLSGLEPPLKLVQKKREQERYIDGVFSILHSPPSKFGINRTTWKMDDIYLIMKRQGLHISLHNIRAIIKTAGYKFKKAKKVLTSNDPNYREKLEAITEILSSLKPNEKFFSIDEYGPFAIKMKGGKRLVPKGERPSYPQFQKSKGWLIMTAALELSSNQVTHFYSRKKDTEEMVKLLAVLVEKYKKDSCLYLSWDAASWHMSKKLKEKVEEVNQSKNCPTIILAPLPTRAQFLNVIESVFSGMSRAIIHNSNYKSVQECKIAIDHHFSHRNQYFKENPKRAGNKIWGKERAYCQFKEGNNCKDPRY